MVGKIANYASSGRQYSLHQKMLFGNAEEHGEYHSLVVVLADATNALVRHKD